MEKCIVIPDSFKGTMSAIEVCDVIAGKVREAFPACEIHKIPIADGGEGTVDCFIHALRGRKIELSATGPFGEQIKSFYGVIGDIAIVEMAAAAGLNLALGKMDPMKASTYGVGELIRHAVDSGCGKIILGLGGSCTNDSGAGMAAALGTRFYDERGNEFVPVGSTLKKTARIDNRETEQLLNDIEIEAMCDINNPMFGEQGAAYIFGPQKGADREDVAVLDANLRSFAKVIEKELGADVSEIPGSGAAGAMGAGVCAFLQGKLTSGIELLLDTVGFDSLLVGCDAVFTGEGKLDRQSFNGKVISGVARRAKAHHVPVLAIAGCVEEDLCKPLPEYGIEKVWPVYNKPPELDEILLTCKQDLAKRVAALLVS